MCSHVVVRSIMMYYVLWCTIHNCYLLLLTIVHYLVLFVIIMYHVHGLLSIIIFSLIIHFHLLSFIITYPLLFFMCHVLCVMYHISFINIFKSTSHHDKLVQFGVAPNCWSTTSLWVSALKTPKSWFKYREVEWWGCSCSCSMLFFFTCETARKGHGVTWRMQGFLNLENLQHPCSWCSMKDQKVVEMIEFLVVQNVQFLGITMGLFLCGLKISLKSISETISKISLQIKRPIVIPSNSSFGWFDCLQIDLTTDRLLQIARFSLHRTNVTLFAETRNRNKNDSWLQNIKLR